MNEQDSTWKKRAFGVLQACGSEFRRTTAIGGRMVQASKASTELHETYEELGKMVAQAMKSQELDWKNPNARVLVTQAAELEHLLNEMEGDVQTLKAPRS